MTTFRIVGSKVHHCGAMIRRLRADHPQAENMHAELRRAFYASAFTRSWLIDGRVEALGGVTGTMVSSGGTIWLAVSERATRFPTMLAREAVRQMREVMRTRRHVSAITVWGDDRAHRFAEFLGFDLQRDLAGDKRLLWQWTHPDFDDMSEAA